jgi:hypothetical protein
MLRIRTSSCGLSYGNGRSSSASAKLPIATVAPIPMASVAMMTRVKAGARRNPRTVARTS